MKNLSQSSVMEKTQNTHKQFNASNSEMTALCSHIFTTVIFWRKHLYRKIYQTVLIALENNPETQQWRGKVWQIKEIIHSDSQFQYSICVFEIALNKTKQIQVTSETQRCIKGVVSICQWHILSCTLNPSLPHLLHPSGCYKNAHLTFMMGVSATVWSAIHFYGNQNANSCSSGGQQKVMLTEWFPRWWLFLTDFKVYLFN